MKFLQRLFSPVLLLYVGLVLVLYIGTYGQLMRNYSRAPADSYYYGGEEYPLDLTLNIAHIREGYEGHWRAFFNLTTAFPQKPSILKFEYILIGKFAKLFALDPVQAFKVSVLVISIAWFLFLYILILFLFKKLWQQILAFLFVLFAASIYEGVAVAFVHTGVFDAQVLFRFTYAMPHYLLGGLTAIISMFCFAQSLTVKRWKPWFLPSIITGVWSALLYGPTIILIAGSIPFVLGFEYWLYKKEQTTRSHWLRIVVLSGMYLSIIVLPLVYIRFVISVEWKAFNLNDFVEKLNPFRRTPLQYFNSLGFIYVLSWLSLPVVLKRKHPFFILLYAWNIVHPLSLFILADKLDLNPIRFYLLPYYVVFGILGVLGIESIISRIPEHVRKGRVVVIFFLTALVLVPSTVTLYHSWKRFELCFCFPEEFKFGYPPKDVVKGIWWLRDNTQNSEIVLSDLFAGTLIPPFAGNIVHTSWWFRLSNVPEVYASHSELSAFFRGSFSNEQAKEMLARNRISYVFYGPHERNLSPWRGEPIYPSLQEVARFGGVVVYKVK